LEWLVPGFIAGWTKKLSSFKEVWATVPGWVAPYQQLGDRVLGPSVAGSAAEGAGSPHQEPLLPRGLHPGGAVPDCCAQAGSLPVMVLLGSFSLLGVLHHSFLHVDPLEEQCFFLLCPAEWGNISAFSSCDPSWAAARPVSP